MAGLGTSASEEKHGFLSLDAQVASTGELPEIE